MAVFDRQQEKIVARVVYDGPAGAGKTTNLSQLCGFFTKLRRSELVAPAEAAGRTLFFDWLQLDGGLVGGVPLRCHLLTVPGQAVLAHRRLHLLASADVIVFVCDSTTSGVDMGRRMLESLRSRQPDRASVPLVVQANKQDEPGCLTPGQVLEGLGLSSGVPVVPAQAQAGQGLRETLVLAIRAAANAIQARILEHGLTSLEGQAEGWTELYQDMQARDEAMQAGRSAASMVWANLEPVAAPVVAGTREASAPPGSADASQATVVASASPVAAASRAASVVAAHREAEPRVSPSAVPHVPPSVVPAPAELAVPSPALPSDVSATPTTTSTPSMSAAPVVATTAAARTAGPTLVLGAAHALAPSAMPVTPTGSRQATEALPSQPGTTQAPATAAAPVPVLAPTVSHLLTPLASPSAMPASGAPPAPGHASPVPVRGGPLSRTASAPTVLRPELPSMTAATPAPGGTASGIVTTPHARTSQLAPAHVDVEPTLPHPEVAIGFVWPATPGRDILRTIPRKDAVRRDDLVGRHGRSDGSGSSDARIYRAGDWCLKSSIRRRFADVDEARQAMLQLARRKIALGELLPARTVLCLTPAADGSVWLWTITPWLTTLRSWMERSEQLQDEPTLELALCAFADAAVQALQVASRQRLTLDVHPSNFALAEGRLVYLDDDIGGGTHLPALGHALLRRMDEYVHWPRAVDGYVTSLEHGLGMAARDLDGPTRRDLVAAIEGALVVSPETTAARRRLLAALGQGS